MSDATKQPKRKGETGGASEPPAPRARRRRLANVKNVRLALADVLWLLETNGLDPSRGRALIYGYSVLLDAIRGSDLETRLAAIEGERRVA